METRDRGRGDQTQRDRKQERSGYRTLSDELRCDRKSNGSSTSRLFDRLQRHLESGRRTSCIQIAVEIMEGGGEISSDSLQQLLEQVALRPGSMQFAIVLWLVSMRQSVTIGVEAFCRSLGSLVQQSAPAQLVRMWLNLAIPKTLRPLGLLPEGLDKEECAEADRGLEEAGGVLSEDEAEASGRKAPKSVLCFTGSLVRPELNGRYRLCEDMTSYHKPVYHKIVERQRSSTTAQNPGRGIKGTGKGRGAAAGVAIAAANTMWADCGEDEGEPQDVIVVHYRRARQKEEGWYFSRKTCSGEDLAFNNRVGHVPPATGWLAVRKESRMPDPLRIVDETRSGNSGGREASRVLSQIDVQRLRGRLIAPDGSEPAAEYFGHFCTLMHLEHLEELRQLRRRAKRAPPELDGLECIGVYGRKSARTSDALGWEDPGSEMGSLALPPHINFERLRLKKGDSVWLFEADGRGGTIPGPRLEGTIADFKPVKGREPAQMVSILGIATLVPFGILLYVLWKNEQE